MSKTHLVLIVLLLGLASCQSTTEKVKWNFQNFKRISYDYHQVIESQSPFAKGETTLSEAKGTLIVTVKKSGKADVIFKEIEMSMSSISTAGDTNQIMSQKVPDFFMQGMDEFGNVSGYRDQQTELISQVLFPLPSEETAVGDVFERPASVPFSMLGSQINVTGFNKIKLAAIEDDIATISTVVDISDFEIPKEANVNYECYMKGKAENTFDIAKGFFKTVDLDITMVAKKLPTKGEVNDEDNEMLKKMAEGLGIEMKSNIKLALKEVQ